MPDEVEETRIRVPAQDRCRFAGDAAVEGDFSTPIRGATASSICTTTDEYERPGVTTKRGGGRSPAGAVRSSSPGRTAVVTIRSSVVPEPTAEPHRTDSRGAGPLRA
jgi:hypothetical protein